MGIVVAIDGLLFVPHTEERGLENVDVMLTDEIGKELEALQQDNLGVPEHKVPDLALVPA